MLFFLLFDVEKKRKHTLNKHRSPAIIPVEGALRMLQTHATTRTLLFVLFGRSGPPAYTSNAGCPTGRFGSVSFGRSLCRYSPFHAVKK